MDLDDPVSRTMMILVALMVGAVGVLGMLIPMTVDLMADLTDRGADYAQWNTTFELVITVAIFSIIIAVLYTFISNRSTKK